jgi:hypothetical protein
MSRRLRPSTMLTASVPYDMLRSVAEREARRLLLIGRTGYEHARRGRGRGRRGGVWSLFLFFSWCFQRASPPDGFHTREPVFVVCIVTNGVFFLKSLHFFLLFVNRKTAMRKLTLVP